MSNWYLRCKKADFGQISQKFNISPMMARLLVNRDVKTDEEINDFLFAGRESMNDPFLFKDMDRASQLIADAVTRKKKIRIFGDYDTDGVCASAVFKKFLEYMGGDVDVRIPDRASDGFGMSMRMADEAGRDGTALVITCDNGISSFDAARRLSELGVDCVITDHHEPPETLPPAAAIVDAKQKDCPYPFKELCGAAVAYKTDLAVERRLEENPAFKWPEGHSREGLGALKEELLQLAGMATIADIVPLIGENRIFAKVGLAGINKNPQRGIKALMDKRGIPQGAVGAYQVGFILSPCINAAGRLENAKKSFDLFEDSDDNTLSEIAADLESLNEKRKELTAKQAEKAAEIIEDEKKLSGKYDDVLVVYLPEAHESVAGIIAGRLKEEYNRPALVITRGEEGYKGSGRSSGGYNLLSALRARENLFKRLGGHAAAAGFTLSCSPEELRKAMNDASFPPPAREEEKVWIDMQLPFGYVTLDFADEIRRLEPFGAGCERPLFAQKNVSFINARVIGKNENVVKGILRDESGGTVEGIYFSRKRGAAAGDEVLEYFRLKPDEERLFTVLYRVSVNEFRGERTVQAVIEEIRFQQ